MNDAVEREVKDSTPKPQRDFETLNDGAHATVMFSNSDDIEGVKVRKLPIRRMSELGMVWGREEQEIALYVERHEGKVDSAWLESLTDESWNTLIEEGRRVNFTRFAAYLKRHKQAMKAMGADIDEITAKIIQAQA